MWWRWWRYKLSWNSRSTQWQCVGSSIKSGGCASWLKRPNNRALNVSLRAAMSKRNRSQSKSATLMITLKESRLQMDVYDDITMVTGWLACKSPSPCVQRTPKTTMNGKRSLWSHMNKLRKHLLKILIRTWFRTQSVAHLAHLPEQACYRLHNILRYVSSWLPIYHPQEETWLLLISFT